MTSNRIWGWIIAAGWLLLVGVSQYHQPAESWLEVRRIHVFDGVEGTPPRMEVDRVIHKPFRGTWVAEVNRRGDNGFYAFCTATGTNNYLPSDALPANLDLDFWTWPTQCNLPAGEYQIDTVWTVRPTDYGPREIFLTSNVFTVRAAQ